MGKRVIISCSSILQGSPRAPAIQGAEVMPMPVPHLSQGTDSVSATSVLCTFVKDAESHFKTMKTCQCEDFESFMIYWKLLLPQAIADALFYLGALLHCCLYWKPLFSYRRKLHYKNNYLVAVVVSLRYLSEQSPHITFPEHQRDTRSWGARPVLHLS